VVSSLPSSPGVYWFIDGQDNVLYVGKAKNLKNRVTSYRRFTQLTDRIKRMVFSAVQLKFSVLESELEALLVEAELIRTHQPEFNILLKDDKTPLYIVITDEIYPRVLTARKKELDKKLITGTTLGPFPSAYKVREVLRIARKIFPWCNQAGNLGKPSSVKSHQLENITLRKIENLTKPCFYYHLNLCPGACLEKLTPAEYQETINHLIEFLKGKKKEVLKLLEREMSFYAENEEYEKAGNTRDKIQLIKSVTQKTYSLKPETVLPRLKVELAEESVIYLRRLLLTYLSLPKKYPLTRIEGYDVSNTQGTNASVAMVTFENGQPARDQYRLFNIKSLDTPNDYAMHQEALLRRQNHPEWGRPDLIVIDGGKGQLRAALKVWHWSNPVISIAKDPDRIIIPLITPPKPKKITAERRVVSDDEIPQIGKIEYQVIKLPETHPALKLIQQIRDESHRFSKKQHSKRRLKDLFT